MGNLEMNYMYYKNLKKLSVAKSLFQSFQLIKILAVCIIIVFGAGCKNKFTGIKTENRDVEDVLNLSKGPNNPRNSEGDFITLKDGRILFIYSHFTGNDGGDFGSAYLAGRYSDDNGKTWTTKDKKIVEQEGLLNVMSVSLLRLKNDEIILFYLKINSFSECIPMMRISTDEAETWSEPSRCINKEGYFNLNNNRIIQLKNGRILMPVSIHKTPGGVWGPESQRGHIFNYFSDDNGRSWKCGVEVSNPDSVILQEPGVLELKNGDIFMFMRTMSGVQYFSYSKDKGETWSAVEPGNLKSSCSPASIVRIPSTQDLLAVWNNVVDARSPLTLAISNDEGKTWDKIKNIEDDPAGGFCYTAVHFTGKDVLLGYGYFYWTSSKGGITIKKINLDWIYK